MSSWLTPLIILIVFLFMLAAWTTRLEHRVASNHSDRNANGDTNG